MGVFLHVHDCGIICTDEGERHCVHFHSVAQEEILRLEPIAGRGILHLGLVRELARGMPGVSLALLPNAHGVVSQVHHDHKFSVGILRDTIHHLALKAHHLAVLRHQLENVPPRRPRREVQATRHGVLLCANACVRGMAELNVDRSWGLDLVARLLEAHVPPVELPCERVAVVQVDIPIVDVDGVANDEVLRFVQVRLRFQHAWSRADVRILPELRSPPKDRVWVPARVPSQVLVDLYGVISEVVMQLEVHAGAVERWVVPQSLEAQNFSVVFQILLELLVPSAAPDEELVVLFALEDVSGGGLAQQVNLPHLRVPEGVHRRLLARLQPGA
mmetsp:Transcript_25443/g.72666  ORF Transcript_25443/g.72666 Transcript_25443/m.72666 type:complete len:331 (-) Transcript_25443:822-1814(-)